MPPASAAASALRRQIADLLAPPLPAGDTGSALPTGFDRLDALLPGGGIPRGRLTELLGARGSGRTTVLRRLVERTLASGRWVAWVDATRTLAPGEWAQTGGNAEARGLWIIRPHDAQRTAWCADVLLRSGAFALVVLDGAPTLSRTVTARLSHLARDHHAALACLGNDDRAVTSGGGGALRLHVQRRRRRRHAEYIRISIDKAGPQRMMEVECVVVMARRLCTHSEVPDRRGVAKRRGAAVVAASQPATVAADSPSQGLGVRRHRRCAEPDVPRDAFVAAIA